MLTRRHLLKLTTFALTFGPWLYAQAKQRFLVNDTHSKLNPTYVDEVDTVESLDAVKSILETARSNNSPVSICGGRHAMGSQQFATDSILIDTTKLTQIVNFDYDKGLIEVESGIQWPQLIEYLTARQAGKEKQWCIIQKPTGTDSLSIAGALAADAHGRGLNMKPISSDIESFKLLNADGTLLNISRQENPELFSLAIGGYGLFGFVYSITLRLMPRVKLRRHVQITDCQNVIAEFEKAKAQGYLYGEYQYCIDETSDKFLQEGILSTYEPVDASTPLAANQKVMSLDDWKELAELTHTNRPLAYKKYCNHYMSTNGQVYWADNFQASTYLPNYHESLDQKLHAKNKATELISEIYVPRKDLHTFLSKAAELLRKRSTPVIYGTIRLIEKDTDCFLAWAKQSYACIIINLHTEHTPDGINKVANAFRDLISLAITFGGSYYLTYHKFATKEQVLACYPQFPEFLAKKLKYDPEKRFQSNWYRHYVKMFS